MSSAGIGITFGGRGRWPGTWKRMVGFLAWPIATGGGDCALQYAQSDGSATRDEHAPDTDTRDTDVGALAAYGRRDGMAAGYPEPEFDAFFMRYERPLYAYLRRLLPSDEVASELAQEAFFRAWSHFEQLQGYDRPEAWLYRVATNLALSYLRKRHPLNFSQLAGRGDGEPPFEPSGRDDELFADPLDVEGQTAERDHISRVLRALPERQRAALVLRAVQGLTAEEVAEALDVTVANVYQLMSRGAKRFRELYEAGPPSRP